MKKSILILVVFASFLFCNEIKNLSKFFPFLSSSVLKVSSIFSLPEKEYRFYSIISSNKERGYLIKNSKNEIIEIGLSSLNIEEILKETKEIALHCAGKNREISSPEVLYFGSTFFFIKYEVFFKKKKIFELKIDPFNLSVINYSFKKRETKTTRRNLNNLLDTSYIIKSFHPLDYFLNSRSTSIASIFNYWEENGYSGIKTSLTGKKLTDKEFIIEINKGCTGCLDRSSIELFAAARGYRFKTEMIDDTTANFIEKIKNEIKNNRPLLTSLSLGNITRYCITCGIFTLHGKIFIFIYLPAKKRKSLPVLVNLSSIKPPITCKFISIVPEK